LGIPILFDIIWLGRGGQGGVTAARLFAEAAVERGLYALAIPFFGAERRGAPVFAYNRVSDSVIRRRSRVRRGDMLVVLDPSLLRLYDAASLLKEGGKLVVNSPSCVGGGYHVDAVEIAERLGLRLAGFPLVNMPMLGAAARVSGLLGREELERVVQRSFSRMVDENVAAVIEGFEGVRPCE